MSRHGRSYQQRRRGVSTEATRIRILDAAAEVLECSGLGDWNLSEVAHRADVSRPTLYAHFSNIDELIASLIYRSMSASSLPDFNQWGEIVEPRDRAEKALTELYLYFERHRRQIVGVLRHDRLVPKQWTEAIGRMVQIICEGFDDGDDFTAVRREALVGHAVRFETWRDLADQSGLETEEAVDLMTDVLVRAP